MEKNKTVNGFKEVVDECVCYYATVSHDHLFSYKTKASLGSKEAEQMLGQFHDPCLVSRTMRQSNICSLLPTKYSVQENSKHLTSNK